MSKRRPLILIIAPEQDSHVSPVVAALLRQHAEVVRIDLADLPRSIGVQASLTEEHWFTFLTIDGTSYDLAEVRSVWNRRRTSSISGPYQPDPALPDYARQFVQDEARFGMEGLWACQQALWVNRQETNRVAEYKPYQLQVARQCGLIVPDTLITTDPQAVRDFYARYDGQVIYKSLHRSVVQREGEHWYVYTTPLTKEHLAQLNQVRTTLHLFQEAIPKRVELRITVIGQWCFAAEIFSQHAERTRTDWRRSYSDLRYGVHALPAEIEAALLRLMQQLQLHYGAIDMIVQPDGRYVFLEVNPCGQFSWIEQETGLPLADALSAFLVEGPIEGGSPTNQQCLSSPTPGLFSF